ASGDYYTTVTTTVDATALASLPTGLPTLPTGTFSLYMGTASDTSAVCLQNVAQVPAWSCDMPPASLQVTISKLGIDRQSSSPKRRSGPCLVLRHAARESASHNLEARYRRAQD
ncbi:hypothetical protein V491_04608, partial [Pseudogymnoascus sp. VKM F-3775]